MHGAMTHILVLKIAQLTPKHMLSLVFKKGVHPSLLEKNPSDLVHSRVHVYPRLEYVFMSH
jgi:hypothetical protein